MPPPLTVPDPEVPPPLTVPDPDPLCDGAGRDGAGRDGAGRDGAGLAGGGLLGGGVGGGAGAVCTGGAVGWLAELPELVWRGVGATVTDGGGLE